VNRDEDVVRDRCLARNGFKVLRFWNSDVMQNKKGVLERIRRECLE
jgi:very-short-patch-repair endonuclease